VTVTEISFPHTNFLALQPKRELWPQTANRTLPQDPLLSGATVLDRRL